MNNSEAVNAVDALEKEIAAVDRRFGAGELNSFGKDEELVLQRFQELRRRQVELSRKQVDLLSSKKTKGRFGAEGQQGLDSLTTEMQKLCGMIEEVEKLTLGAGNEDGKNDSEQMKDSDDD